MSTGKVLLGVLAGVAVGATLGILFAPDKGSNTRKKIATKGEDYADGLSDSFNNFIESIKAQYETLKSETAMMSENGLEKGKELADKAITYAK